MFLSMGYVLHGLTFLILPRVFGKGIDKSMIGY